MNGDNMKFIILRSQDGGFYFVLKAKNGKIIAVSETYKRKQNCYDTIHSIQVSVSHSYIEENV